MLTAFFKFLSFVTARYFFLSGGAYFVFYKKWNDKFQHLKIQKRTVKQSDITREIFYSLITFCIFALQATIISLPLVKPYTRIYSSIGEYGWYYFIFSIFISLFIHDTYFYFTHKLMHHKKLFRYFHAVHHQSTNPTPFAAFSFHPLEAIVESGIVTILAFTLPIHIYALLIYLFISNVLNVYGHLGYEIMPSKWRTSFIGQYVITSHYHNLHHQYFDGNYGLYFQFWDRIFKTKRQYS